MFIIHSAAFTDTGMTITAALMEMGVWGTDRIRFVEEDWGSITSPAWTKKSPFQRMPWMEDTDRGLVLHETRTILRYIANRTSSILVPDVGDTVAFWTFDQQATSELYYYAAMSGTMVVELWYAEMKFQRPALMEVVKYLDQGLRRCMDGYERILSSNKWLCGDQLTLVDLFHANNGLMLLAKDAAPYLVDGTYPQVARWWSALSGLPSVEKAWYLKQQAIKEALARLSRGRN